jgi:hypothetical protein
LFSTSVEDGISFEIDSKREITELVVGISVVVPGIVALDPNSAVDKTSVIEETELPEDIVTFEPSIEVCGSTELISSNAVAEVILLFDSFEGSVFGDPTELEISDD